MSLDYQQIKEKARAHVKALNAEYQKPGSRYTPLSRDEVRTMEDGFIEGWQACEKAKGK